MNSDQANCRSHTLLLPGVEMFDNIAIAMPPGTQRNREHALRIPRCPVLTLFRLLRFSSVLRSPRHRDCFRNEVINRNNS